MAKPLDAEEEALAALLARCGLGRPAARCLAALLREAPLTSADAAAATGLASQDVSVAMRELEAEGLVAREAVPSGRGRPQIRHRLPADAAQALARLDSRRRASLHEELARLDELRARFAR